MNGKKELAWGQTPWDDKPRDELLRDVQRMYSAIVALDSCLSMSRHADPAHPYFGADGSGGRALEMARQILEPLHEEYESEDIYRSFFRYAGDLLFEQTEIQIGFGWIICPVCGTMIGQSNRDSHEGQPCSVATYNKDCAGVMRKLTWNDLQRQEQP